MCDRAMKYIVPGQERLKTISLVGTITEIQTKTMTVAIESECGENFADAGKETTMTFSCIPHTGFEVGDRVYLTWERESNAEDSPR